MTRLAVHAEIIKLTQILLFKKIITMDMTNQLIY